MMLSETKQKKTTQFIEGTQYIPSVGSLNIQKNQTRNAYVYVKLKIQVGH